MRLSVVIPTRNRPDLLADCLETMTGQPEPPGGMEVLVIDDGSDQPLEPAVTPFAARGIAVRCIRQPSSGLNAARNRGLREAKGELVAFLDDDTLLSPGWAMAIHDGFERERCDVIGGRITLQFEGDLPRWLTASRLSYLSRYDLGNSPREVREPPLPFGANFALTRSRLEGMEPFKVGLDRAGSSLVSNGEIELLRRVLAAGGRIVYWPAAAVAHRVPPERLTKAWFRSRALAQGISDVRSDTRGPGHYPVRVGRELLRSGRAVPILGRRLLERRGPFDSLLWLTYCHGRIQELGRQQSRVR
jgi:glycosyltransferase involved in cell wall biosynthesis